jgi:hypothetical protein
MFNFCKKKAHKRSTEFSRFIRLASSREKKRVYTEVLKKATEMQLDIIRRAPEIK